MFRVRFRTCTKGKHPKTHKQTHQTLTQDHHAPHRKHVNMQNNMAYTGEWVRGVHVCPWWAFMGVDGFVGTQLRFGTREGGKASRG